MFTALPLFVVRAEVSARTTAVSVSELDGVVVASFVAVLLLLLIVVPLVD